jgi:hypothetical protein
MLPLRSDARTRGKKRRPEGRRPSYKEGRVRGRLVTRCVVERLTGLHELEVEGVFRSAWISVKVCNEG